MLPRKHPVRLALYYSACNPSLQACCEEWVCISFSSLHLVITRNVRLQCLPPGQGKTSRFAPRSEPGGSQETGDAVIHGRLFQYASCRHSSGSGGVQALRCWVLGDHNKEICLLTHFQYLSSSIHYQPLLVLGFWTGRLWF